MSITRRKFTQVGLGTGALMAMPLNLSASNPTLIKRKIPSSGEAIPVIGVGTNRYGVGADKTARAILSQALQQFHALGGTVIDTAPSYGSSEIVLGELIDALGIQDDLFLASKVDRRNLVDNTTGYPVSYTHLTLPTKA